ncbi:MAG: hypothetical protein AB1467_04600 [Candidatus Diapherotrites archaeon]
MGKKKKAKVKAKKRKIKKKIRHKIRKPVKKKRRKAIKEIRSLIRRVREKKIEEAEEELKKGRLSKKIEFTDVKKELTEEEELAELLSPRRGLDLKILQMLEDLPKKHFTTLLLVEPTTFSRINIELIRLFSAETDKKGIYVTLNRSFQFLNEVLKAEKIDISAMHFIDGITRITGRIELEAKNCQYIESPNNLVELSQAIENAIDKMHGMPAFLIFDSISTLLIYNNMEAVERFIHSIVSKLQESKLMGLFLMVKSPEKADVINTISQFCDKTLELNHSVPKTQ